MRILQLIRRKPRVVIAAVSFAAVATVLVNVLIASSGEQRSSRPVSDESPSHLFAAFGYKSPGRQLETYDSVPESKKVVFLPNRAANALDAHEDIGGLGDAGVKFLPKEESEESFGGSISKSKMNQQVNSQQLDGSQEKHKNIFGGADNSPIHWKDIEEEKHMNEQAFQQGQQRGGPSVKTVPEKRIVHFDLKGAAPKVDYLKSVVTLARRSGATGILFEWEDMLPYSGPLLNLTRKIHYSEKEVDDLLTHTQTEGLEIIPLVQTFGHVEYALKNYEFKDLREVPRNPQAICPSRPSAVDLVKMMVDQTMSLHAKYGIKFLHIGCDEVFHMGECDLCREKTRETLFLSHVRLIGSYVREKYGVIPIIWDDMLRQFSASSMLEYNLGKIVEPMVWVYAEDIYRFVSPSVFDTFAEVFPTVWGASAIKGAFGETLTVPPMKRHLDNNVNWLDVISREGAKFKHGFRGLVLTAWQRYDHFAVLCELLPSAMPSMVLNLIVSSEGGYNWVRQEKKFKELLNCPANLGDPNPNYVASDFDWESDPNMFSVTAMCGFPGSRFMRLAKRYLLTQESHRAKMTELKAKGWFTDYNLRHRFTSPSRIDEFSWEFSMLRSEVNYLITDAERELAAIFDNATVSEWIEFKIYPMAKELAEVDSLIKAVSSAESWPRRPLPPDPEFVALTNALSPSSSRMIHQQAPALGDVKPLHVEVNDEVKPILSAADEKN